MREFGRRAWRRPLSDAEQARYLALLPPGRPLDNDAAAAALVPVVAAFLQSPNFLYRSEIGEPDPTAPRAPAPDRASSWPRGCRISCGARRPTMRCWTPPQSGALATAAGLDAQTRRMLTSPRARQTMAAFFVELFRLRRLDRISENRTQIQAVQRHARRRRCAARRCG